MEFTLKGLRLLAYSVWVLAWIAAWAFWFLSGYLWVSQWGLPLWATPLVWLLGFGIFAGLVLAGVWLTTQGLRWLEAQF